MNRTLKSVGLITLLTICSCVPDQTIDEQFSGTYKLDRFESFDLVSEKWITDKSEGIDKDGFLQYDGKGHMSVHIFPRDYKDFDISENIDSLNQESLKQLIRFYQTNFVYFAEYKVSDTTITHYRISATEPKNWGIIQTRRFEFRKDTLILSPLEKLNNKRMRLRWVRLLPTK